MAEQKTFAYIDPAAMQKFGVFAQEFMHALNEDITGRGGAEELATVLERHAVNDDKGNIVWEATAEKLTKGLNTILPDQAVKTAAGTSITREGLMKDGAGTALKLLFTQDAPTNIADMAKHLLKKDLQVDATNLMKQESLAMYLYRMAPAGLSYDVPESTNIKGIVASAIKALDPSIDISAFEKFGEQQNSGPKEHNIHSVEGSLMAGFESLKSGSTSDLAHFLGYPNKMQNPRTGEMESISYNKWDAPNGSEEMAGFFDKGHNNGTYYMGKGGARFKEQNFDSMFIDRWQELGFLKFEDEQARQNFSLYARAVVVGGRLDDHFIERLSLRDRVLVEDEDGKATRKAKAGIFDFKTPAAKQAFKDFTSNLNTSSYNKDELAEKIVDWVLIRKRNGIDDIDMIGASGNVLRNFVATNASGIGDDSYSYAHLKSVVHTELKHYMKAETAEDFSDRMIEYAKEAPGVNLDTKFFFDRKFEGQFFVPQTDSHQEGQTTTPTVKADPPVEETDLSSRTITPAPLSNAPAP